MASTRLLEIFLLLHLSFCIGINQATLHFIDAFDDRDVGNKAASSQVNEPVPGSLGKYFVYVNCTSCNVKSELQVKAKSEQESKEIAKTEIGKNNRHRHVEEHDKPAKSSMRTEKKYREKSHNRENIQEGGRHEEEGGKEKYDENFDEGFVKPKKKENLTDKDKSTNEKDSTGAEDEFQVLYFTRVIIENRRIHPHTNEDSTGEESDQETTEEENDGDSTGEENDQETTEEENDGETTEEENDGETTEEENADKTKEEENTGETIEEGHVKESTTEEITEGGKFSKGKATKGESTEEENAEKTKEEENTGESIEEEHTKENSTEESTKGGKLSKEKATKKQKKNTKNIIGNSIYL